MYAIIRAGGKQAKVRKGDVIDVERIKTEDDKITFTPLLVVGEDGSVISGKDALEKASVTAEIIGESRGEKIDVFKYKNKSGYRRRQGHRQRYTRIHVIDITTGATKKKTTKKKAAAKGTDTAAEASEPAAETAEEA